MSGTKRMNISPRAMRSCSQCCITALSTAPLIGQNNPQESEGRTPLLCLESRC